jgi:hypothetical protein
LQGNYIRKDKGEELREAGCSVKETKTHVCAAFGQCEEAAFKLCVDVEFNYQYDKLLDSNKFLNKNLIKDLDKFKISLDFLVVDNLPFEVIVGREDMLRHDLWERVIKPQSRIEKELKKSKKPITSDIKTRPKSKCQKRRKRDSANGEEPRRGNPVPTLRSITESWLITDSQ